MAEQRLDRPYSQFNFRVSWDGLGEKTVEAGFQEVSGLGLELTVAEYRAGNHPANSPLKVNGTYKTPDVTLKRGVIGTLDPEKWDTRLGANWRQRGGRIAVTGAIVSGALPPGVTLQPDGTLTGTSTVSGTYVLELELCDDGSPIACVLRPLTIIVDQVVGTTPVPPVPQPPDLETPAVEPPGPVNLEELPFTGLETQGLLALAMTLLGAGVVLLRMGRSEP